MITFVQNTNATRMEIRRGPFFISKSYLQTPIFQKKKKISASSRGPANSQQGGVSVFQYFLPLIHTGAAAEQEDPKCRFLLEAGWRSFALATVLVIHKSETNRLWICYNYPIPSSGISMDDNSGLVWQTCCGHPISTDTNLVFCYGTYSLACVGAKQNII